MAAASAAAASVSSSAIGSGFSDMSGSCSGSRGLLTSASQRKRRDPGRRAGVPSSQEGRLLLLLLGRGDGGGAGGMAGSSVTVAGRSEAAGPVGAVVALGLVEGRRLGHDVIAVGRL